MVFVSTILSADRISSNSLRGLRNADPPASATRSETGESPWQSAPRKWQSMPPLSTLFVRGTAICVKLFCQFHAFCLEVMWVWQLFLLYSWRTSVHKFKTKKGFFCKRSFSMTISAPFDAWKGCRCLLLASGFCIATFEFRDKCNEIEGRFDSEQAEIQENDHQCLISWLLTS